MRQPSALSAATGLVAHRSSGEQTDMTDIMPIVRDEHLLSALQLGANVPTPVNTEEGGQADLRA